MVGRVRIKAATASTRARDKTVILELYGAELRAIGIAPSNRATYMKVAKERFGDPRTEPPGLAGIRAMVAVLDGFPVDEVTTHFPQGYEGVPEPAPEPEKVRVGPTSDHYEQSEGLF